MKRYIDMAIYLLIAVAGTRRDRSGSRGAGS
jgi:hypothetical protein